MYTSEADISKYRYIAVFERVSVKKQSLFFPQNICTCQKKAVPLCNFSRVGEMPTAKSANIDTLPTQAAAAALLVCRSACLPPIWRAYLQKGTTNTLPRRVGALPIR
jgi:hypothetical protein